jgi:putative toxin-antitoxin system antitoxin component (TIGR02293 family)
MSEMESVVEILGGKRALGSEPQRESDFIPLVRRGVPFPAFRKASDALDLSLADLERALGLSARTLLRRKHGRLSPVESERFLRLVRVVARAQHVLGARDAALDWLRTPNAALEGAAPISLLDTEIGAATVLEVLGRIEHTVYG